MCLFVCLFVCLCLGWREISHLYLLSDNDKQKGDWISLIQAIIVSHAKNTNVLKRANTINTSQPYSRFSLRLLVYCYVFIDTICPV